MNYYDVIPGNYLPAHDSSIVIPRLIEKEKATEAALYLEDKYNITDRFSVNAGIRFSSFFVTGPRSVFLYSPDFTKSTSSITDTVVFGKFRNYKTYAGPELRISANYRLNDNSSFKLNYNHTRQYLHLLSNTVSISPSDIWKLSDYHLKPQSGDQFAAGYYRMLNKNKIEASAEIYYKIIDNMIDDIVITQYTDRNKYRIPYYSRMDFSVRISGNLKIKRLAHPHWIFSVYNLTGRDNVYSVFFRQENNRVKGYYLSVFGKPVPSLSFNFDF
jgi:outer membrane receptor for monomeric catechols